MNGLLILNLPAVPHEYNPVGSYRRSFLFLLNGRINKSIIHFGAVKSAFYIWINGKYVGYSQGSKTPAEWNITNFLIEGENSVSLTGLSLVGWFLPRMPGLLEN